jgi:hypothetical protein
VLRSQILVFACMECAVFTGVHKCQFHHGWSVLWSKLSVSACFEYVLAKHFSFGIFKMCHGKPVSLLKVRNGEKG